MRDLRALLAVLSAPGGRKCMPLYTVPALRISILRCMRSASWAGLSVQVRVLGWERVTKGFDARTQCDRRRYEYLLPASAFRPDPPSAQPAQDCLAYGGAGAIAAEFTGVAAEPAVAGSAQTNGALRAAAGWPGSQTAAPGSGPPGALHAGQAAQVLANGGACAHSSGAAQAGSEPGAEAALSAPQQPGSDPAAVAAAPAGASADAGSGSCLGLGGRTEQGAVEAPLDEAERARVDAVLATYVGTHNFHNFTVRMAADDPGAKRYILSFRVGGALQLQARDASACHEMACWLLCRWSALFCLASRGPRSSPDLPGAHCIVCAGHCSHTFQLPQAQGG